MTGAKIRYAKEYTDRLELLWGEGLLSPGGTDEVAEILEDIRFDGEVVLDFGCGLGGIDVILVKDYGAETVVAVDIEPQLIERVKEIAANADLADRIHAVQTEGVTLSFDDESFDAVFSKDVIAHIPNKLDLFIELHRVLKPGGVFIGSDWLAGETAEAARQWSNLSRVGGNLEGVVTAAETELLMSKAGFVEVGFVDRSGWYAIQAEREIERLEGPLREEVIDVSSEQIYENWLAMRRAIVESVRVRALQPTHFKSRKRIGRF